MTVTMVQQPESLVSPRDDDAAKRRLLAGVSADNGAPTGVTVGVKTRNHAYLHATLKETAGGTLDVTFYGRPAYSDEWGILTWIGTSGVVSLTANATVLVQPAEIHGIDEVYLHADNFVGGTVDAWLAGSTHT